MRKCAYTGFWLGFFLLFVAGTCEAYKENGKRIEAAFFAISSLCFHLEEMNLDQQSIAFDDEDITYLWEIAASEPAFFTQVEEARQYYYEANCLDDLEADKRSEISRNLLRAVWEEFDSYLLQMISISDWISIKQGISRNPYTPAYPEFDQNPCFTDAMRIKIRPFLLPLNFSEKDRLDALFTISRVIETEESFNEAGFEILFRQPFSYVRIAKHPLFPGFLFKIYLDSELRKKDGKEGWEWLALRCEGAKNVRNLIKKKKLRYFSVPDKWIYPLPYNPLPKNEDLQFNRQPIILLVTDMDLVPHEESIKAWKNKITHDHLDELYCIISHGFASSHLIWNIPYSKSGKFACIDTENPEKKPAYREVRQYLSKEMCQYWDKLVRTGGKRKRK